METHLGDLCFLTDNPVLVNNIRPTRTIFCVQRKGQKVEVTEELLIKANLASFGDDIGKTTNYITSMYDVQAQYEPGSVEYETLAYRIQSGQLIQQNCIDKAKGIVCKPMPKWWYDYRAASTLPENVTDEDVARRDFNLSILADRKPYFMRYIYPKVMHEYNKYMRSADTRCGIEFRMTVAELLAIPASERTSRQNEFVHYFESRMPVSNHDCVMNRICRRFEREFDGRAKLRGITEPFDGSILKYGGEYSKTRYSEVLKLYRGYMDQVTSFMRNLRYNREYDDGTRRELRVILEERFAAACHIACPNEEELSDIVVDICYRREGTKQFAWDMCGMEIVRNLVNSHGGEFYFPILDPDGDIEYGGERFSMMKKESEVWLK